MLTVLFVKSSNHPAVLRRFPTFSAVLRRFPPFSAVLRRFPSSSAVLRRCRVLPCVRPPTSKDYLSTDCALYPPGHPPREITGGSFWFTLQCLCSQVSQIFFCKGTKYFSFHQTFPQLFSPKIKDLTFRPVPFNTSSFLGTEIHGFSKTRLCSASL